MLYCREIANATTLSASTKVVSCLIWIICTNTLSQTSLWKTKMWCSQHYTPCWEVHSLKKRPSSGETICVGWPSPGWFWDPSGSSCVSLRHIVIHRTHLRDGICYVMTHAAFPLLFCSRYVWHCHLASSFDRVLNLIPAIRSVFCCVINLSCLYLHDSTT